MFEFAKQFILHPVLTGAVLPTSETLSDLITDLADLGNAKTVVELGPGTGVFTEKIVQKISKETKFFAIEINEIFADQTRKRCPTVSVFTDSAINIQKYLNQNNLKECDSIISGLPFAGFSKKLQEEIMDAVVSSLKIGGKFLTFAYLQGQALPNGKRFKKLLDEKFSRVEKSKIVWNNFPPAFVYVCTK